jgi:hypothetical protein
MNSSGSALTPEGAVEIARQELIAGGLGGPLANRTVTVTEEGEGFKVVFSPPSGVRGGAFTIIVSNDGRIVSKRFER